MATFSRAARAYTGYPAQIFLARLDFGRGTQRYIEKLLILDKWYSALRGYLPVMMEKDTGSYNKQFFPKLDKVDQELLRAYQLYKPTYEGESYDPEENDFNMILRAIMIDLDAITAESKAIDNQKSDEESFDAT